MDIDYIKSHIRMVPDYPSKGINFWDVTTLFKDAGCLRQLTDEVYRLYKDKGITKVAGLESRGFIIGAAAALRLGAGFVPIRKPGKLPAETFSESYMKEYGTDTIEIHTDAITPDDVVLLHDDLIATGGSADAAVKLIKRFHPKAIYANFLLELDYIGKSVFPEDIEKTVLIRI